MLGPILVGGIVSKTRQSHGPFLPLVCLLKHTDTCPGGQFLWMSPSNLQKWEGGLSLTKLVVDNRELTVFYM